ncbi:MAG: hypothetical protein QOF45_1735 [Gaiellaceae bacterium]|nr:hypothetical protein [Gaiellaceae bacterium]
MFPARYELVFHDRIPREAGMAVFELPAGCPVDPQQELAAAPIVEVRPAAGSPWTGIFFAEAGANIVGTLIGWPDEESLCFLGGGGAYVVSSSDPSRLTLIDGGPMLQQQYVVAEAGIVLFADWTNLHAYDRSGLLWRSARLALDDLAIEGVEDDVIACSGFFGGRGERFTVDLRTGKTSDSPLTFGD